MEKKGKKISIFFYGPNISNYDSVEEVDTAWDKMNSVAKRFMTGNDIIIRYNDELNVISVFEKEDEELKSFINEIKESVPDGVIYDINW